MTAGGPTPPDAAAGAAPKADPTAGAAPKAEPAAGAAPKAEPATTLADVAARAGVSLATASRVLNGSTRAVGEELRRRVTDAAAELDYTPNHSAQAIARGSSDTMSLIVSDISDPYFSAIASGVAAACDERSLVVTMAQTGRDSGRELQLVRTVRGQRPRGILLTGSRFEDDPDHDRLVAELRAFERAGGRVVVLSQPRLPFATLDLGNADAGRALAERLLSLGYRRFALVGADAALLTSSTRLDGVRSALAAAGAPEPRAEMDAFTRDGGYAATTRLLESDGARETEVIVAANDVMAIGALSAVRDAGLTPGADVAVAGFDDIATARDVTPALTTVRFDLEGLGRAGVARAFGDADAPDLAGTVVVRASTPRR